VHAGPTAVRTGDGLELVLAADGAVSALRLDGRDLALAGPGGFGIEEVLRPAGRRRDLGFVRGTLDVRDGRVHFRGAPANAALEVEATFRGGACLEVSGEVRDLSGAERAVLVLSVEESRG
jgi:hypothetical protein